ncbi:hypothetical protein AB1E18_012009 [Capra hircus]
MTESEFFPFQGFSGWWQRIGRPLAGPRPAGSAALVGTGQRRASGSVVEGLPQKPGARRPGAGATAGSSPRYIPRGQGGCLQCSPGPGIG